MISSAFTSGETTNRMVAKKRKNAVMKMMIEVMFHTPKNFLLAVQPSSIVIRTTDVEWYLMVADHYN